MFAALGFMEQLDVRRNSATSPLSKRSHVLYKLFSIFLIGKQKENCQFSHCEPLMNVTLGVKAPHGENAFVNGVE
jgi:hypothetical protein